MSTDVFTGLDDTDPLNGKNKKTLINICADYIFKIRGTNN